MLKLKLLKS